MIFKKIEKLYYNNILHIIIIIYFKYINKNIYIFDYNVIRKMIN